MSNHYLKYLSLTIFLSIASISCDNESDPVPDMSATETDLLQSYQTDELKKKTLQSARISSVQNIGQWVCFRQTVKVECPPNESSAECEYTSERWICEYEGFGGGGGGGGGDRPDPLPGEPGDYTDSGYDFPSGTGGGSKNEEITDPEQSILSYDSRLIRGGIPNEDPTRGGGRTARVHDVTKRFNVTMNYTLEYFCNAAEVFERNIPIPGNLEFEKYRFFANMVAKGQPFDLKAEDNGYSEEELENDEAYYTNTYDLEVTVNTGSGGTAKITPRSFQWRYDQFGNVNFGVAARAFGISTDMAQLAAGLAQINDGNSDPSYWDSFFDEPNDQQSIRNGFQLFDKIGGCP